MKASRCGQLAGTHAACSIAAFRLPFFRGNILEQNVARTAASVGEALVAGAIFTLPAFLIARVNGVPVWETFDYWSSTWIMLVGGVLGVLFVILLRRTLCEDADLPFPESAACAELVEKVFERTERIDLLVNNAGISAGGAIWELEPDVFARVTRTHIDGTYNCTRHAVPHMREAGWGRIVNLVSRSGLIGIPGTAAYGTGKGGIFGFTNVVSRDLAPFGITVNGVNPASTDTRMVGEAIEKGRRAGGEMARRAESLNALLQQPEDVAVMIAALCSEEASAITGQFFFVRGTEIGVFRPLALADTTSRDTPWSAEALAHALCALEIPPLDSPY